MSASNGSKPINGFSIQLFQSTIMLIFESNLPQQRIIISPLYRLIPIHNNNKCSPHPFHPSRYVIIINIFRFSPHTNVRNPSFTSILPSSSILAQILNPSSFSPKQKYIQQDLSSPLLPRINCFAYFASKLVEKKQ